MILHEDICRFLRGNGLECDIEQIDGYQVIRTAAGPAVLPVSISETDPDQARTKAEATIRLVRILSRQTGSYPLIITEDRWRLQTGMMQRRLLAHLRIYVQIYARNCEVRKIDKKTAAEFLQANHSYGDAACRHRYGLFLKRYTGHSANGSTEHPVNDNHEHSANLNSGEGIVTEFRQAVRPSAGELVAVATFSNGRKWVKGEKTIRSYEWTRYASLPGVRLSGGMGRLMKAFIDDVKPDDIMTYADLEWSEGGVYEALGFVLEGVKSPVLFEVDTVGWRRNAHIGSGATDSEAIRYFQNFGSNKYRLKLTEYV